MGNKSSSLESTFFIPYITSLILSENFDSIDFLKQNPNELPVIIFNKLVWSRNNIMVLNKIALLPFYFVYTHAYLLLLFLLEITVLALT